MLSDGLEGHCHFPAAGSEPHHEYLQYCDRADGQERRSHLPAGPPLCEPAQARKRGIQASRYKIQKVAGSPRGNVYFDARGMPAYIIGAGEITAVRKRRRMKLRDVTDASRFPNLDDTGAVQ